jgi:hypothetical protein
MIKVNAKNPSNERFEFEVSEEDTIQIMYDKVGEYITGTGKKLSDYNMKLIFAGRILQKMDDKVCDVFPKGTEEVGIIFLLQQKPKEVKEVKEVEETPAPPPSPAIAPSIPTQTHIFGVPMTQEMFTAMMGGNGVAENMNEIMEIAQQFLNMTMHEENYESESDNESVSEGDIGLTEEDNTNISEIESFLSSMGMIKDKKEIIQIYLACNKNTDMAVQFFLDNM